jgi:hypothetical protein
MGTTPEDITKVACSLALDCGTERCRVQLFHPKEGEVVSRNSRGSIQDRNQGCNPGVSEGVVKLVVAPGLVKLRDWYGGLDETELVHLHPAAVYCSVGDGDKGV